MTSAVRVNEQLVSKIGTTKEEIIEKINNYLKKIVVIDGYQISWKKYSPSSTYGVA